MKRSIKEMLETYTARDLSPWHMPGHKRKCVLGGMWDDLFRMDVTEVPGTDDLHHAAGPILESERAAAEAVGAKYAHYLVGGSTAGILASIAAAAKLWREKTAGSSASTAVDESEMTDPAEGQPEGGSEVTGLSDGKTEGGVRTPAWAVGKSDLGPAVDESGCVDLSGQTKGLRPVFLVAANCHKSVWNGLRLAGAKFIPLEPEGDPVYGPISSDTLLHVLAEEVEDSTQVAGCIVTSPTYGGSLSSLGELHAVLQVYGIPLIVDMAHGAHLPFCEELAWYSGIHAGAEYVVASLHKTLPALTQTAVLYVSGEDSSSDGTAPEKEDRADSESKEETSWMSAQRLEGAVAEQLAVFQSSSPSYILMLSAEESLAWADENRERFDAYIRRMQSFREELTEELMALELVTLPGVQDPTRLMLRCRKPEVVAEDNADSESSDGKPVGEADDDSMTGVEMAAWLEENVGIVVELAGSREIILISTVCDEAEDLQRLKEGLLQLDHKLAQRSDEREPAQRDEEQSAGDLETTQSGEEQDSVDRETAQPDEVLKEKSTGKRRRKKVEAVTMEEAAPQPELQEIPSAEELEEVDFDEDDDDEANAPTEVLCKEAAVPDEKLPRVGDFVQRDIYVYPPGVPILRAGERVTEEALHRLKEEQAAGRRVYGL